MFRFCKFSDLGILKLSELIFNSIGTGNNILYITVFAESYRLPPVAQAVMFEGMVLFTTEYCTWNRRKTKLFQLAIE
jgi:hypothetical protein